MAAAGAGGAVAGGPGAAVASLARQVLESPQVKSRLAITLNRAANASGKAESIAATTGRLNGYIQSLDSALGAGSPLPLAAADDQQQVAQR